VLRGPGFRIATNRLQGWAVFSRKEGYRIDFVIFPMIKDVELNRFAVIL